MSDVQLGTLGSTIKQAYEDQTNTNAYTDADKQKVADLDADLAGKEDSLGNPDVDDKVLSSKADGTRFWKEDAVSHLPMAGDISGRTSNSIVETVGGQTATAIASVVGTQVPDLQTDVDSLKLGSDKLVLNGETKAEAKADGVEIDGELKVSQSGQDKALVLSKKGNDEEFFSIKNKDDKVWLSGHNGRDVEIIVYDPTNVMPSAAIKCTFDDVQMFLPLEVKYGGIELNNNKITNLKNPTTSKDAANKEYVDAAVAAGGGGGGGGDGGPVSELVDSNGDTRIEARTTGAGIDGKLEVETDGSQEAIVFNDNTGQSFGMGYTDTFGVEFKSYKHKPFLFKVQKQNGTYSTPLNVGFNGVIFDELAVMNYGLNMNNSKVTNLKAPNTDTDAANKKFVVDTVDGMQPSIDAKEDYLGKPSSDNMVLCSNLVGTRFWMEKGEVNPDNYPLSGDLTGTTEAAIVQSVGGKTAQEIADAVDAAEGDLQFTGLRDTPNSYVGNSDKVTVVNATEDGLAFASGAKINLLDENGNTRVTTTETGSILSGITVHNADIDTPFLRYIAGSSFAGDKLMDWVFKTDHFEIETFYGKPLKFRVHDNSNSGSIGVLSLEYGKFKSHSESWFERTIVANEAHNAPFFKYKPSSGTYSSEEIFTTLLYNEVLINKTSKQVPFKWQIKSNDASQTKDILQLNFNQIESKIRHWFHDIVDMKNNKIQNLADPTSAQDAATKQYVLDSISSGGAGKPTKLYNDDDVTVVHGTTEGVQLKDKDEVVRLTCNTNGVTTTGVFTMKQIIGSYFFRYTSSTDNKVYMEIVDFGDKIKHRLKYSRPYLWQCYDENNANPISVLEMSHSEPFTVHQKGHFRKGVSLANQNDVNWLEAGETDGRKTLYIKTDPLQNNQFTANYSKSFIFKIDSNVDSDDSSNATIFSISSTYVVSHKKHRFYNGIDMQYKRVEFVGDPEQPRDATTKSYVDSARSAAVADSTVILDSIRKAEEYNVLGATYKAYFSAVRTGNLWNCTLHLPKADHSSSNSFLYGTVVPDGWRPQETITQIVDSGSENIKAYISTTGMVSVNYSDDQGNPNSREDTKTSFSTTWIIPV